LKVCSKSIGRPTTFLDLTPSAFFDFASAEDSPSGKHIFYNSQKVLNMLFRNNCQLPKLNIN
jgi:hypothetical protein